MKFQDTKCFHKSEEWKNSQHLNSNEFKNQKNKRIQNNVRIRACSKIKRMKEFKMCDLLSYYRFKMESGKLKSYALAFKKRVLIRLEENDNNIQDYEKI